MLQVTHKEGTVRSNFSSVGVRVKASRREGFLSSEAFVEATLRRIW